VVLKNGPEFSWLRKKSVNHRQFSMPIKSMRCGKIILGSYTPHNVRLAAFCETDNFGAGKKAITYQPSNLNWTFKAL
jgi:hypothetical protein